MRLPCRCTVIGCVFSWSLTVCSSIFTYSFSAVEGILLCRYQMIHYRVHHSALLDCLLSRLNAVHLFLLFRQFPLIFVNFIPLWYIISNTDIHIAVNHNIVLLFILILTNLMH